MISAMFIRLIIRLFPLVFSAGTVFFSHNKSSNGVFSRLISTAERLLHFVLSIHGSKMISFGRIAVLVPQLLLEAQFCPQTFKTAVLVL
jgi:hypothetical protein